MLRTYKSKKDTGGGLDHREMVHNLGEKSSLFDAFYIQNIKQIKREQSCMGASNQHRVIGKQGRKRKYVKKVVKDVELPKMESPSTSVFLTPDKSIRVNKALDLFDQLLNSSLVCTETKRLDKKDLFGHIKNNSPKETKIYRRKRSVKKYDYSSDNSDSEKENFNKSKKKSNPDDTDIKMHELVIEKEALPSPEVDQSINNIVKKLSLINKINREGSISEVKKNVNTNRLTLNVESNILSNSPLCSTPFNDKERSKSIYKFSPIPMGALDESPKYITIVEDEALDQSIIFVPKHSNSGHRRLQNRNNSSPTDCNKSEDKNDNSSSTDSNKSEDKNDNSSSTDSNKSEDKNDNSSSTDSNKSDVKNAEEMFVKAVSFKKCELDISKNEKEKRDETNSLQISEFEPFLGFPLNNTEKMGCTSHNRDNSLILVSATNPINKQNSKCIEENDESEAFNLDDSVVQITKDKDNDFLSSQPFLGFTDTENIEDGFKMLVEHHLETDLENTGQEKLIENIEISDIENADISLSCAKSEEVNEKTLSTKSQDDKHSLYDTCGSDECLDEGASIKKPTVKIKRLNSSLFRKYYEKIKDDSEIDGNLDCSDVSSSNSASSEVNSSANSQYDENLSFYDSCTSKDSSSSDKCITKDPIVQVEKMNASLFEKYYNKVVHYSKIDESQCQTSTSFEEQSSDSASFITGNDSDCTWEENSILSSSDLESKPEEDNSIDMDASVLSNDNHDDRVVSFVTTRRRNNFTNNCTIFVFDESQDSASSEECDKTVLSNRRISLNKQENFDSVAIEDENVTIVNKTETVEEISMKLRRNKTELTDSQAEMEAQASGNIKTTLLQDNSSINISRKSTAPNIEHGIVLQPGKKWERSLSIYRRMTMTGDHFDHSLIDGENLQNKGRKYRQSVIETMEMQDYGGSLHNESVHSRRSTFIPKPSRSTIRIVKESNNSKINLSSTSGFDDLKCFLEDCDDTIVDLSKLSIADDHEITVLDKFHETNRVTTAREYVLRRCNQAETLPFDECYPDPLLKNCRKIGEGVYGEVYLWRAPDGRARVMKIVPIAGSTRVNGEQQKDFHEIISEIVIAMELSALRAPIADVERHFDEGNDADTIDLHSVENATDVFNEVLGVRCVFGAYPSRLLDLWELYDESRGSDNDNPAALPPDQEFLVLELANAGQDLESYQFNSAEQAYALFLQLAFALAVGEEAYQFEHRDLHWGNVLIAPTDQKYATFVIRGRVHRVPRRGVACTIIDYSLSRVSMCLTPAGVVVPGAGANIAGAALYNDLANDEDLFNALGDYQFEVYRLMRDKLGNDWKNFEPHTNILWLHYIVDKMITSLRYKRSTSKIHKQYIGKLKDIKDRLLDYGSAAQFVLTDNEY